MRQSVYPERALVSRGAVLVTTVAAALVGGFVLGESAKPLQGQARAIAAVSARRVNTGIIARR